jgi:hypothetical protein
MSSRIHWTELHGGTFCFKLEIIAAVRKNAAFAGDQKPSKSDIVFCVGRQVLARTSVGDVGLYCNRPRNPPIQVLNLMKIFPNTG